MTLEPPFSDDIPPTIPPVAEEPKKKRGRPPGSKNGGPKPEQDKAPKTSGIGRAPSWPQAASIEASLSKGVEFLALSLAFVNPADAQVLADHGPTFIHEMVQLAVLDKRYRRYLEMLAQPGKYGPVIASLGTIILGIASNHGVNPFGLFFSKAKVPEPSGDTLGEPNMMGGGE